MYRPLCPCPSCSRHVLSTERACPFCGAAMPGDFEARARPDAPRGLRRAAAFAFATTLVLGACSSTTTVTDAAPGADANADAPADAAARDAPQDVARDAAVDDGGFAALYGDPPPRDAGAPDDEGAPLPEYGAPWPVDAGASDDTGASNDGGPARDAAVDDGGGSVFLYGAPPPPEPP